MSQAAAPAPDAGKKKGKGKLLIILVATLVLALGGGGAAYFFMGRGDAAKGKRQADKAGDHGEARRERRRDEDAGEAHEPAVVALPTFTVNLADKDAPRYLRTTVSLVIKDTEKAASLSGGGEHKAARRAGPHRHGPLGDPRAPHHQDGRGADDRRGQDGPQEGNRGARLEGVPLQGERCPPRRIRRPVSGGRSVPASNRAPFRDVPVVIEVLLGKGAMPVRQLLRLEPGVVLRLDSAAGADLVVRATGVPMALGEVVIIEDSVAARVTHVLTPSGEVAS